MLLHILQVCILATLKLFNITKTHLYFPPLWFKGGANKMYHLAQEKNKVTSLSRCNGNQGKIFESSGHHNHKSKYMKFHHQYLDLCKLLANECCHWKAFCSNKFTVLQCAHVELNVLMCSSSLSLTWLSNQLEHSYLLLVTLLVGSVWKLSSFVFSLTLWSKLWSNKLLLRNCQLKFKKESLMYFIETFNSNNNSSKSVSLTVECIEAHSRSASYIGDNDIFRSLENKKAEKELNRNLHTRNETEASGLFYSVSNQNLSPATAKHLSPTSEVAQKVDLLGGQEQSSHTKQNVVEIETTSYATNTLPGATGSQVQHYETNFDEDIPLLSLEETRKNVRVVRKEKDVDSVLQSYQKIQAIPAAIGNTSQPMMQDKTQPPAKTVRSLNVNKSHRSLPRRACLVYHKEQYHLDNNLLSQPRATKYLIKVRTEICPGRYMAKLELHCSR